MVGSEFYDYKVRTGLYTRPLLTFIETGSMELGSLKSFSMKPLADEGNYLFP